VLHLKIFSEGLSVTELLITHKIISQGVKCYTQNFMRFLLLKANHVEVLRIFFLPKPCGETISNKNPKERKLSYVKPISKIFCSQFIDMLRVL
jgi:hypothetical protein